MASFSREARLRQAAGASTMITGASINPATGDRGAPARIRCECGGWLEAFVPGSVNLERVQVEPKEA